MRAVLGMMLAVAICGQAGAQEPKKLTPAEEAKVNAEFTANIHEINVMSTWHAQFDAARTRDEKLSLLQFAWTKSLDQSLSELARSEWHDEWLQAYKKGLKESLMPNPYE